jgi:hypothetical protein
VINQPDTRPPAAPKEGCYAVLRNGEIVFLKGSYHPVHVAYWDDDGRAIGGLGDLAPDYDIIALISLAIMAAVIDGRVMRLIEEFVELKKTAVDVGGNTNQILVHGGNYNEAAKAINALGDLP